jgi:DNA-binding transcriptional ArsR family regulator
MKSDIFHAIADPTRRTILVLIAAQAMTPNTLAQKFDSSRQAVSKHIKILTGSNLLKQEKVGREIYYHFNPDTMKEVDLWLEQVRNRWEQRFDQLDNLLINLNVNKHENQRNDHELFRGSGKQKNTGRKGV